MSKKQNYSSKKRVYVDYKPAELKINTDWLIVYYAKIPAKDDFKRFRLRVPVIKPKSERIKYGKKMVASINQKLENGWSPFFEENNIRYKSVEFCASLFLEYQQKEVDDKIKRPDTLRAYKSALNIFLKFVQKHNFSQKFIIEIDTYFIRNYLDFLYFEKKCTPRTYNNHLRFVSTFFEWCKIKNFISQNPANGIKSKPKTPKKREILPDEIKQKVRTLKQKNFHFFVLCMVTYYCFIRRTELTKLKVSDVNLLKGFIVIDGEKSKNKKTESVTIPNIFLPDLALHLTKATNSDFLFSDNDFKPGKEPLSPKKISDQWAKFRRAEKFDTKYQFYSLKDTGITDLLNSGIPAIKVRDQARHHDLKITESYTARNKFADEFIKSVEFDF